MVSTKDNLQILYEDNHILIINKRAGDIVQGDKTGDVPLSEIAKQYLKEKYNKKGNVYLGVVHRLDRPTTGIVVFAKTSKVLPRLNSLFADKDKVLKKYWAVLEKNQTLKTTETLTHWLVRNPKQNKSKAFDKEVSDSKKSILQYRILQTLDRYYLVEVQLFTGRHHQIRSQLSTLQCPIKGDVKYGAKRINSDASIHLHAREIRFLHPIKKEEIHIIAPVPDLWKPFV
ncbi:RluA family pseudouridine synthase [Capnocytophaga catalasegens]|uniref:RNA pseudouridine synthase n=1 Tax=Capnocytophaga catalasegens TaxID=1004260 RepID=A0AAV5AZZ9_9FLAO|nr:RluA family pseudouridine synthase [Capnocytophaga catalasegens]GIZ14739.1 RNA pseudouridine synthase [Capnocytophaga catalasegens]GJM50587.1 RNA pseudouridine synthase [Capnocytophaga catalasegens]GJM53582.1 RNA pseudouridine synthase [Capnocytophaga catalasegens]